MVKHDKILNKILKGTSDKNIPFKAICQMLTSLGFTERVKGSHHIFTRDDIDEILNLQSKGSKSKPYQMKQVREIILKYKLGGSDDE